MAAISHSINFQGIGWEYETELPDWAQMEWMDGASFERSTPIVFESIPTTTNTAATLTDSATTTD